MNHSISTNPSTFAQPLAQTLAQPISRWLTRLESLQHLLVGMILAFSFCYGLVVVIAMILHEGW